MARKRVLLDSSVLISAILSSSGASYYLLSVSSEDVDYYINEYILEETIEVTKRKFANNQELFGRLFVLLSVSNTQVLKNPNLNEIKKLFEIIEREDAPILASALKHCDHLVTLDNDFFANNVIKYLHERRLSIMKPGAFVSEYLAKP